jgi:hypothetical protein
MRLFHNLRIKIFFLLKLLLRIWRKIIIISFGLSEKVEKLQLNLLVPKSSAMNTYEDIQNISGNIQPMELFINQKRFDIVFKYFYAMWASITNSDFPKHIYLSHIFAFNNFYEIEPYKKQPKDFLDSFNELLDNVKNAGFNKNYPISVHSNGELENGAHRLVSAMISNNDISTVISNSEICYYYNYCFFNKGGISNDISDLNACLYVPMNPLARIFILFPVVNPKHDDLVRFILNKFGFIYYEKELRLTYNGFFNLKKIIYSTDEDHKNDETTFDVYEYLKKITLNSMAGGKNPLRVFVWVSKYEDDIKYTIKLVESIYSNILNNNIHFHLSSTHEEAIELSQIFFNENSLYCLDNRPYTLNTYELDNAIDKLKKELSLQNIPLQAVCACENIPMFIFGISEFKYISFLCIDKFKASISINLKENDFFIVHKDEIILNPKYHFYYHGIKIITLDVLLQFKRKRNNQLDDENDIYLIREFKDRSWSIMSIKHLDEKASSINV